MGRDLGASALDSYKRVQLRGQAGPEIQTLSPGQAVFTQEKKPIKIHPHAVPSADC